MSREISSLWQNHPTETFCKRNIFFCTKTHFPFKRIRVRNVYNANVQYMYFNYDTKGNIKLAPQEGQRDVKIDR